MSKNAKNLTMFVLVITLVIIFFNLVMKPSAEKAADVSYSQFQKFVAEDKIVSTASEPLKFEKQTIKGAYESETGESVLFETFMPFEDPELMKSLKEHNISFKGVPEQDNTVWRIFLGFLPWLFLAALIWFFMMRQIQSTGNRALSFGRSKAKLNPDMKNKITFGDVAGVDEAKQELIEVVDFLKEPKKFQDIGARIPLGVLLVGPPGTGKTLLARAVAGEAGVPFFSISGSDFVEMFVGVGASRVRDLFAQAKKQSPCIIFIDEIDAVGRLRGAGLGGGHDEREQTLNQLLVEMDGFETNEGIIVIAATNRADVLDPALLRPGRFDRQVVVDTPDLNGREKILEIHSKKVPLDKQIKLGDIAKGTPGFTGADLANLINEAALLTARRDKKKVTQDELEEARDKVMMGPERKSFFIGEQEKAIIAYHEAGHAVISALSKNSEPIHKVSIIPRGRALGITMHLPEGEKHLRSRNFWVDEIAVLMGGRLAEEIQFKDVTTGASNDIERASVIARKMVTEWGMSDKIGPLHLSESEGGAVFIGRDYTKGHNHSEEYAKLVDQEVKKIIDKSFNEGRTLLKKYKKQLDGVARHLLDKETITGDDVYKIVGVKPKVSKPKKNEPKGPKNSGLVKKAAGKSKEKKKVIPKLDVNPA